MKEMDFNKFVRYGILTVFVCVITIFEGIICTEDQPDVTAKQDCHGSSGNDGLGLKWNRGSLSVEIPLEGLMGPAGSVGELGPVGLPGLPGPDGSYGLLGPIGPGGYTGLQGHKGRPGKGGEKGQLGRPGERGEPGEPGSLGRPGRRGIPGDVGEPGLYGEKGQRGDYFEWGPPGERGQPGPNGERGEMGEPGDPGIDGLPGLDAILLKECHVSFKVALEKALDTTNKIPTPLVFDKVISNKGQRYEATSGQFVTPYDGIYVFYVTLATNLPTTSTVSLQRNEDIVGQAVVSHKNRPVSATSTYILSLKTGDRVWLQLPVGPTKFAGGMATSFAGNCHWRD